MKLVNLIAEVISLCATSFLKNRVDLILDLLEREPSVFGVVIAPDPELLGPKGARQEMSDPWDLME